MRMSEIDDQMNPKMKKEDIFNWFSALSASNRIEVVSGLLHLCVPLEVHFFWACLENLSQKQNHTLHEIENYVNSTGTINYWIPLMNQQKDDNLRMVWSSLLTKEDLRARLTASLALLHSSNHACANLLYSALIGHFSTACVLARLGDEVIRSEVLLIYSLAAYHPAFSFEQRLNLCGCYHSLGKAELQSKEPNMEAPPEGKKEEKIDTEPKTTEIKSEDNETDQLLPPSLECNARIRKISAKGYTPFPVSTERYRYVFQVVWSNNDITVVQRDLASFYKFYTELRQRFADKEKHFPILSLDETHTDRETPEEILLCLKEYSRKLTTLPLRILHSDLVHDFFAKGSMRVLARSTSLQSEAVLMPPTHCPPSPIGQHESRPHRRRRRHKSCHLHRSRSNTSEDESLSVTERLSAFTLEANQCRDVSCASTTDKEDAVVFSSSSEEINPPVVSAQSFQSRSSCGSSCKGCSSTEDTEWESGSTTAAEEFMAMHEDELTENLALLTSADPLHYQANLSAWLKTHRMHKYLDVLSRYSCPELVRLNRVALETTGQLTKGAVNKLLVMLGHVRRNPDLLLKAAESAPRHHHKQHQPQLGHRKRSTISECSTSTNQETTALSSWSAPTSCQLSSDEATTGHDPAPISSTDTGYHSEVLEDQTALLPAPAPDKNSLEICPPMISPPGVWVPPPVNCACPQCQLAGQQQNVAMPVLPPLPPNFTWMFDQHNGHWLAVAFPGPMFPMTSQSPQNFMQYGSHPPPQPPAPLFQSQSPNTPMYYPQGVFQPPCFPYPAPANQHLGSNGSPRSQHARPGCHMRRPPPVCYTCGISGHKAAECPRRAFEEAAQKG